MGLGSGKELDGVDDDVALGACVADFYVAGLARLELVGADWLEESFFCAGFLLIDGDGGVPTGMVDGDGDVAGAIGQRAVGDGNAVFARLREVGDEAGLLLTFSSVAIVAVALEEEAGGGVADGVKPGELGLAIIDDDAAKLFFGEGDDLWDGRTFKVEHLAIGF